MHVQHFFLLSYLQGSIGDTVANALDIEGDTSREVHATEKEPSKC